MYVFLNRRLLKNIIKSYIALAILLIGVHTTTNLQGGILGYGTVWFHLGGIYNIMSLSKVAEKYRVSYNRTGENKFLVYLPRVEVRSFRKCDIRHDFGAGYGASKYCRSKLI